jgi:hypothetical protein
VANGQPREEEKVECPLFFPVQGERVSPNEMDAALRAFWRGSAGEIDRLAGAGEGDTASAGTMLLRVWRYVGGGRCEGASMVEEDSW